MSLTDSFLSHKFVAKYINFPPKTRNKPHVPNIIKCKKDIFVISLYVFHFRMFPFVSLPPSQSITLRRWHRRRSRRNHDDAGGDDDEVRDSKLLQHSISRTTTSSSKQNLQHHIIFYVTLALLFTVSQGNKLFLQYHDS